MFLICGHGRSGTLYTSKVFTELGLIVPHEKILPKMHGLSSWKDIDIPIVWDRIYLQLRHPLMTIASTMGIMKVSREFMYARIGKPKIKGKIYASMYSWYYWNKYIEDNLPLTRTFHVEDLESHISRILLENRLHYYNSMLSVIQRIPKNTHTRGRKHKLTWKALYKTNEKLAEQIQTYAEQRGYR